MKWPTFRLAGGLGASLTARRGNEHRCPDRADEANMFFSRGSISNGLVPLVIAGIIGPIWFTTLVIVQGFLQPDYSHVAMPISALAAWPYGWIQILNFLVMGALMTAYTIGVHHAIRPTPFGLVSIGLLLVNCLGLVLAGVF